METKYLILKYFHPPKRQKIKRTIAKMTDGEGESSYSNDLQQPFKILLLLSTDISISSSSSPVYSGTELTCAVLQKMHITMILH